jgi:hypothetical protein
MQSDQEAAKRLATVQADLDGALAESEAASAASAKADAEAAQAEAQAAASAAASNTADPAKPPRKLTKFKHPNLPAPKLDAFIAAQYPGYRVIRRVSYPGQVDPGRLSVNYLLQYKREPRFKLVVTVAELKSGESSETWNGSDYYTNVGRVLTRDDSFSVEAVRLNGILGNGSRDALIDAIVAKNPTADTVWGKSFLNNVSVDLDGESGPHAMDYLIQQGEGESTYSLTARLPVVPGTGPIKVDVATN